MAETKNEYNNDNIKVTETRKPRCQISLEVAVTPESTTAAWRKAIKNVNKEVSMPGFRKGRAPEEIILKNFAKAVDEEWRNLVLRTAFNESIAMSKVYPFSERSVTRSELKECSKEDGAECIFEYECEPEIPAVSAEEIKLEAVVRKEIGDEDIAKAVEDLRLQHAEWDEVKDRGVQENDFVSLDIEDIEGEEPRVLANGAHFEVADGKMGKWMRELIMGAKVDESVEGMSERDDTIPEGAEFKPTKVKITVKAVLKPKLPEITDEFAKGLGFDDVATLNERVVNDLNRGADGEVRGKLRGQLEKLLVENYSFELPASIVENERRFSIKRELKHLKEDQKLSDDTIKGMEKAIEEKVDQEVTRRLRLTFLSREVARAAKIEIENDDLVKEYTRQMIMVPPQHRMVDKNMEPEELRSKLYVAVLVDKAMEHLLDKVAVE